MKNEKEIRQLRKELKKCITKGCRCNCCIIQLNEILLLDMILGDNTPQSYFIALTEDNT